MWRRISSFPLRGVEGRLRAHMKLVLMATELLRDLIEGCISYNWSVVQSVAENIAMTEREADDVKRGVELHLYSGALFVGLKEDFLRLAEAIDQIADKAKDASRALASRQPKKVEMDELEECHAKVREIVSGTVEIVKILERSIEMMSRNSKTSLQLAHEVEKFEEKLDDEKLEALKYLTKKEENVSTLTYLQARDFIFLLDMVADAAEEASDVITAMIVKSGA
jgi:predicted phosphate transport protein (TIGR00153 family)